MKLGQQRVRYVLYVGTVGRRTLQSLLKRLVHTLQTVELLRVDLKHLALDQLITVWPLVGIDLEHQLNDGPYVVGGVVRDTWKDSFADALIQVVHVTTTKRWLKREHFVDDAAQRPDIRLVTVRLIFPDLR